jgi:hypothetical protein
MGLLAAIRRRAQGKGRPADDELLEIEGEDDQSTGERVHRGETIEDAYRPDGHTVEPDTGGQII